jgi:hypothetical protein
MSGIDYGRGLTNIDKNGIRYGVISVHSLSSWLMGEVQPIYPESIDLDCPECKQSFASTNLCPDDCQTCPHCEHESRFRELDNLEPIGWDYFPNNAEIAAEYSESLNCLFITKSPYVTYGGYCSPCAPGAIDLDNAEHYDKDSGQLAYCLGHDCFDDGEAPYKVFLSDTLMLVKSEKQSNREHDAIHDTE